MFSQYISTSKKNKKKTCFHVPTSPPDCSPQLKHYPTFRCFHFWHSSKTKKKHTHPQDSTQEILAKTWIQMRNLPALNPRGKPHNLTASPPKRRTQRISSEEKLPKTCRWGDVLWKKTSEKKTCIFENTPCSIFQKKHDHLQIELMGLCGWLCFRRLSEPFLVNKSEEPLYDTAQLLGVPLRDFPLSVDEPTGGYQLWKQPDTPCYLSKYILSYYVQRVSTHLRKSLERSKKLPQNSPRSLVFSTRKSQKNTF